MDKDIKGDAEKHIKAAERFWEEAKKARKGFTGDTSGENWDWSPEAYAEFIFYCDETLQKYHEALHELPLVFDDIEKVDEYKKKIWHAMGNVYLDRLNEEPDEHYGEYLKYCAMVCLKNVFHLDPGNIALLKPLGDVYKALTYSHPITRDIHTALDAKHFFLLRAKWCYEKYLEKQPEDVDVIFSLANLYYFIKEDYEKAEEYLERGLSIAPDDVPILQRAAETSENMGDYNRAIELYERVLKIKQDYHCVFGIARTYASRAENIKPGKEVNWRYVRPKEWDKAVSDYKKAIEYETKALELRDGKQEYHSWWRLEVWYSRIGEYEKAIECRENAKISYDAEKRKRIRSND